MRMLRTATTLHHLSRFGEWVVQELLRDFSPGLGVCCGQDGVEDLEGGEAADLVALGS